MGLFRKKEKTHFERDPEGRVIQVTRNGKDVDKQELKMKTGRQLEQEYYKAHPEKRHPTLRKIGAGMERLDKRIVDYNKTSNIMSSQRSMRRPVQRSVVKKPYSTRDNYNPFGTLFDTGMPKPKQKKPSSRAKYAVVGGKAYPIAGTGTKKTTKKKSTKRKQRFDDPFDNMGWF